VPIGQTWACGHLQLRSRILQMTITQHIQTRCTIHAKVCKAQAFFSVYMWRVMLSTGICPASTNKKVGVATSDNAHSRWVTLHFFPTFWKLLQDTPFRRCGQMRMELPPSLLLRLAGHYCSTSSWSLNCGSDLQIYVQKIQ
jgi:hypothetical protein